MKPEQLWKSQPHLMDQVEKNEKQKEFIFKKQFNSTKGYQQNAVYNIIV